MILYFWLFFSHVSNLIPIAVGTNFKKMKKHIPNTITLLNLLSGCMAIVYAMQGNIIITYAFIAAALLFDFMDGLAARLLHAYSDLGKELDSLADLVSFGVAPAFLIHHYIMMNFSDMFCNNVTIIIGYFPFILVAAMAYRLARFNIDSEQSVVFKGLPAPASALLWVSFVYFLNNSDAITQWNKVSLLFIILSGIVLGAIIVVSTIPMFSLKFKNLAFKSNEIRYVFLAIALVLFGFFGLSGFFLLIWLYILVSGLQSIFKKKQV